MDPSQNFIDTPLSCSERSQVYTPPLYINAVSVNLVVSEGLLLPGSGKNPPAMQVDPGCLIPGLGRSPGEGNGNPLQYSCLENPMDRGAWWATAHGVARVGHDLATKLPPP